MLQQSSNEFQLLLKALGYIKTHWWVLVLELALIYGYALHTYSQATPEYLSHASILIDNFRKELYRDYMLANSRRNNSRKENMVELLKSEEIMERFRNSLTELYNKQGRPNYLKSLFPAGVVLPTAVFRSFISLSWDSRGDIFHLSCKWRDGDAAHDICQAYMNTIQKHYPEIGQRDALMKREFLNRQLASLSRQISEAEVELIEYQKKTPGFLEFLLIDEDQKGRSRLQKQLADINDKITVNRAKKELFLKVPRAQKGEHVSRETAVESGLQAVTDLRYRLELTKQSKDPNREERIAFIEGQIREAEARLSQINEDVLKNYLSTPVSTTEVTKTLAQLELDYQIQRIQRDHVEQTIVDLNEKEKLFSKHRLTFKRLKDSLTHKKRLLNNLYKLEQETELELSAGNAEIYRLREPSRPMSRVAPRLSKYLYGSLSISVFFLAITIIVLMATFPRIDSETEVNKLNLPIIGKVPTMRQTAQNLDEIPTYAMEYLKIMNYRILRETKDIKCPIVIITSGHAREGKSTVTNALTLTSMGPNRKTLLIDGDLLTNRPSKFFGIQEDQTQGLHALLQPGPPPDPRSLIVKTMNEGMSFLPRGQRFNPSALPNFLKPIERTLADLRKEYDIIFIDTPPLFASNLSHQWAGLADLIVLVARIYVTRPKDVSEAIQTCKIYSRAPVGIALNCMPLSGPYRRASNYYFSKKKSRPERLAA